MFAYLKEFFKRRDSIARASFYIALFSLISRLMGLFRDRLFAAHFGAGPQLDTYFAAFKIPDFIYNLLIIGAISSAFIPVFTRYLSKNNDEKAFEVADSVMNLVVVLWLLLGLLIFIFASQLMRKLAPGFEPWQIEQAAKLTRIMLLSPLFFGISTVCGSILNSYRRFFSYALAPVLYNAGIIIAAAFFTEKYGVYALAYGVIFGAFMHMIVQLSNAYLVGFRWRPILIFSPGVMKIIKLAIPRVLGMATDQINSIVEVVIGSTLFAGAIAALSLAQNLAFLPVGLFGVALSTAAFPSLSEKAGNNDKAGFVADFSRVARTILFLIIPATVIFIVLRAQIVRIILGTGNFTWQNTRLTFSIMGILALSMFAEGLIALLARSFYAFEDTKTPVIISVLSVLINIILALVFTGKIGGLHFGAQGLAAAYTIATVLQMFFLVYFLKKRIKHLDGKKILGSTARFVIVAAIMVAVAQWLKILIDPYVDLTKGIGVLTQFLFVSLISLVVYFLFSYIFKVEEFEIFTRLFPFFKRKGLVEKRAYDERKE